jgi:type IV fimbrial biogenesis protein FimT
MGTEHADPGARRKGGFTLVELMIVLAVAGTILALGAPSFNDFRRNNRLTAAANDFITSVQLARTEAIKRQRNVVVCASGNADDPGASCNGGNYVGWIVFEDRNGNCLRSGDEPLLGAGGPLDTALANNADGNCLSFSPTGFAQVVAGRPALSRLVVCDERGLTLQAGTTVSAARGITIARTGRALVHRSNDMITAWGLACDAS